MIKEALFAFMVVSTTPKFSAISSSPGECIVSWRNLNIHTLISGHKPNIVFLMVVNESGITEIKLPLKRTDVIGLYVPQSGVSTIFIGTANYLPGRVPESLRKFQKAATVSIEPINNYLEI